VPYLPVVALLEGIQLAVVRAPVRIDLRLLIPQQYAPHRPLTVHEAAVANLEVLVSVAAWAPDLKHFLGNGENTETFVDNNKLVISCAFLVVTVTEPREAV
jgi:hypothetical protein